MRHWWVNHKQTVKQEIGGGYLWAPEREAGGARSQFYDNMRVAAPGDLVFSYAGGAIGHIGRVVDFAVPAPKPDSFGTTGGYWSAEGWLLSVVWQPVVPPIRPKDKLAELRRLLPLKYSPINREDGNGNQKAYLAEVSQAVFDLLLGTGYRLPPVVTGQGFGQQALIALEDSIEHSIKANAQLDETTRQQMVQARRGQGMFRTNVVARSGAMCCLTGVTNPALLVASHIKPWRVCVTALERLDGANGLMLAPHVDCLFDRGLISFEDSGQALVSPALELLDLEQLGLAQACRQGVKPFDAAQVGFMAYHRSHVFLQPHHPLSLQSFQRIPAAAQ